MSYKKNYLKLFKILYMYKILAFLLFITLILEKEEEFFTYYGHIVILFFSVYYAWELVKNLIYIIKSERKKNG